MLPEKVGLSEQAMYYIMTDRKKLLSVEVKIQTLGTKKNESMS